MENKKMENMEKVNEVVAVAASEPQVRDYAAEWSGQSTGMIGRDWCSWAAERNDEMLPRITGEAIALADVVNTKITVTDVYLENVQVVDDKTGEEHILPRILLICPDQVVSCVSMTAFTALSKIMRFKGTPTPEHPLFLKPIQNMKGQKRYYNFQVLSK